MEEPFSISVPRNEHILPQFVILFVDLQTISCRYSSEVVSLTWSKQYLFFRSFLSKCHQLRQNVRDHISRIAPSVMQMETYFLPRLCCLGRKKSRHEKERLFCCALEIDVPIFAFLKH